MPRSASDAGFAIGPILFVLALLGIIAAVIAAGSSDFGVATISDRIYNNVYSQANLIRTKINECNLRYGSVGSMWPASDPTNGTPVCALSCPGDPSTAEGVNDCQGNTLTTQNLWSGLRPAQLPPPTSGLNQWYYIDASASGGGRCIWTGPSAIANEGIIAGFTKAASQFSSQEVAYNPSGTSQNFVIWITVPTGTANTHCVSN